MDIATSTDLLGVETRSTGFLFSIGKESLKTRSSVFALGERINILKDLFSQTAKCNYSSVNSVCAFWYQEIDQPALIPHIAEAKSQKYPYEVLFRSLQKLLIDTATSEYLFTDDFFGEESIFHDIFAGFHPTFHQVCFIFICILSCYLIRYSANLYLTPSIALSCAFVALPYHVHM
jgi:hypothetical protein